MQKPIHIVAFLLFFALSAAGCFGGTVRGPVDPSVPPGEGQERYDDALKFGVLYDPGEYSPIFLSEANQASTRPPFLVEFATDDESGLPYSTDSRSMRLEADKPVTNNDGTEITVATRPQLTSQNLADIFSGGNEPPERDEDTSQLGRLRPVDSDAEPVEEDQLGAREYFHRISDAYPSVYQWVDDDGVTVITGAPNGGVYELRLEYARLGIWNSNSAESANVANYRYFTLADELVNPPQRSSGIGSATYEVIGDFVYDYIPDGIPPTRFFPDGMLTVDFQDGDIEGVLTVGVSAGDDRAEDIRRHFGAYVQPAVIAPTGEEFGLDITLSGSVDTYAGNSPDRARTDERPQLGGYGFGADSGVTFDVSGTEFFDSLLNNEEADFRGNFYGIPDSDGPPNELAGWVSAEDNLENFILEGGFLGKLPPESE